MYMSQLLALFLIQATLGLIPKYFCKFSGKEIHNVFECTYYY